MTSDYSAYMEDLKSRVQKTRENFSATVEQYDRLKERMLKGKQVRHPSKKFPRGVTD